MLPYTFLKRKKKTGKTVYFIIYAYSISRKIFSNELVRAGVSGVESWVVEEEK